MTEEKKLHLVTDRRASADDVEPETEEQRAAREARERHPSGYRINPPPAEVAEQLTQHADDGQRVPLAREVHTAFLVLVEQDGTVRVETDLDQQISVERQAHFYDFVGACHNVIIDVEASKNAQVGLQHQMAMAAQLQQQAKNAELGLQVQQELERQKGRR